MPSAVAAILLSREFPLANLDTDGTLFTVVIYGASYSDTVTRIRAWMNRWQIGPVLELPTRQPLLSVQGTA
jgi:hypothetical protein